MFSCLCAASHTFIFMAFVRESTHETKGLYKPNTKLHVDDHKDQTHRHLHQTPFITLWKQTKVDKADQYGLLMQTKPEPKNSFFEFENVPQLGCILCV